MTSPTNRTKSPNMSGKTLRKTTSHKNNVSISNPLRSTLSHNTFTPEQQYEFLSSPMPDRSCETLPRNDRPKLSHSRSGSHFLTLKPEHRLSTGPSVLMSSMSSMPSLKQSAKKEGGLKATIKRMFGSKRQRTFVDEEREKYHVNDPGNLMAGDTLPQTSTPTSSRPRTATRGAALTSHAVEPVSGIHNPDDQDTEPNSTAYRRRNTLPSLVFSEHEEQSFSRRLGLLVDANIDNAAASDTKQSTQEKRRSRSADALAEKYVIDNSDVLSRQDREGEIAFWRNSMHLTSLPRTAPQTFDTMPVVQPRDDIKEMRSLEHIIKPAQSFDFGLANPVEEPADLEERVNTLEVKMYDFEYALAKLQGIEMPKPDLPRKKKMKRKNVQEMYSKSSMRSLSTATSGLDAPPITPGDSPVIFTSSKAMPNQDRDSKSTTIRPYVQSASDSRSSLRLTVDQFDALMAIIQDEKDARQLMEMQLVDLQREIELLQAPVYATINYPPTSPVHNSSKQKKLHRSPPFRINRPPLQETSNFNMTESDSESVNDNYVETYETPREYHHTFDKTSRQSP